MTGAHPTKLRLSTESSRFTFDEIMGLFFRKEFVLLVADINKNCCRAFSPRGQQ
jgi:hypothetical protein